MEDNRRGAAHYQEAHAGPGRDVSASGDWCVRWWFALRDEVAIRGMELVITGLYRLEHPGARLGSSDRGAGMAVSDKKRQQIVTDAQPVMQLGESVLDATTGLAEVKRMGSKTRRRASILVTDRRVVIFSKKLGGYDVQDFAFGLITGVDHKKGMTSGHLTIRASGDSADLSQVEKTDVERISQVIRDRMALTATSTAPANTSVSLADELTKFVKLRDSGVLSAEEFAAQKSRLLG